jgi:hypothetical protein
MVSRTVYTFVIIGQIVDHKGIDQPYDAFKQTYKVESGVLSCNCGESLAGYMIQLITLIFLKIADYG